MVHVKPTLWIIVTMVVFSCWGSVWTAFATNDPLPSPIIYVALCGLPVWVFLMFHYFVEVLTSTNAKRYQFAQKVGLISKYAPFPGVGKTANENSCKEMS